MIEVGSRVRVVLPGSILDGETGTVQHIERNECRLCEFEVMYDDGGNFEWFDLKELEEL